MIITFLSAPADLPADLKRSGGAQDNQGNSPSKRLIPLLYFGKRTVGRLSMGKMVTGWAVCALCLPGISKAQEPVKICPKVELRSLSITSEIRKRTLLQGIHPRIETGPAQSEPQIDLKAIQKEKAIVSYGPVLGSMDSPAVKTSLVCTAEGFVLDATIERSANFNGAVLQNVNWMPRIEMRVTSHQPEIILQVKWKMVLTTGSEVHLVQTPPYPDQKFPIVVTRKIQFP